jgi:hypothetical protein
VIDKHVGYGDLANPSVGSYKYIQYNGDTLPFVDKAFDWVFSRHTLEHVRHPDIFLKELSRVGRNLYIVTPSPLSEFYGHGTDHFWVVYVKKGTIHVEAIPPYFKYDRVREQELPHLKELEAENEGKVGYETVYIKMENQEMDYRIIGNIDAARYEVMDSLYRKEDNLQNRKKPSRKQVIKHGKLHDYLIKSSRDTPNIFACPQCAIAIAAIDGKTNEFKCKQCNTEYSENSDHVWDFTM